MSEKEIQTKPMAIMDVNPAAVGKALRRSGCARLIHGHTHRPGVHTLQIAGQPARRYVLGDWYDQGSMLECDRDGCRLQELGLQG